MGALFAQLSHYMQCLTLPWGNGSSFARVCMGRMGLELNTGVLCVWGGGGGVELIKYGEPAAVLTAPLALGVPPWFARQAPFRGGGEGEGGEGAHLC